MMRLSPGADFYTCTEPPLRPAKLMELKADLKEKEAKHAALSAQTLSLEPYQLPDEARSVSPPPPLPLHSSIAIRIGTKRTPPGPLAAGTALAHAQYTIEIVKNLRIALRNS